MKRRLPFGVAMAIAIIGALWGIAYGAEILKGNAWWHMPTTVTAALAWVFGWLAIVDWS